MDKTLKDLNDFLRLIVPVVISLEQEKRGPLDLLCLVMFIEVDRIHSDTGHEVVTEGVNSKERKVSIGVRGLTLCGITCVDEVT